MTTSTAVPSQRRVWHFLEMLLAMSAGMLLLAPIEAQLWSVPAERADLHVFVMTCNMTAGMLVWALVRRHPWVPMIAAMWAPFLLLASLHYFGVVTGDLLMAGGHVLMLPCMFLAARRCRTRQAA